MKSHIRKNPKKLENKNWKKNDCMGISSDKMTRLYTRRPGHGYERETLIESESFLIAAQNNAIRTSYVKAKIDNTQQERKCSLCCEKDLTINHLVSEYSKLT